MHGATIEITLHCFSATKYFELLSAVSVKHHACVWLCSWISYSARKWHLFGAALYFHLCPVRLYYIFSTLSHWYGHVKRMPEERIPKLIMEWVPQERRKRGRPRKTWMEGVQAAMTTRNLETDQWRNREEWRLATHSNTPPAHTLLRTDT